MLLLFWSSHLLSSSISRARRQSVSLWRRRQALITGVFPSPPRYIHALVFVAQRVQRSHFSSTFIALIWPTHALALLTTGDSFTGVRNREASPAGETTAVCHLDCRTYSKLCFTDVVCCVSVQRPERSHQGASLQARYAHANRRHDVCTPLEKDLGTR